MLPLFNKVTIIGVGLLGGSLALACKKNGIASLVTGYGRRLERIQEAQEKGIVDEVTNCLEEAVCGADLTVLCTPVIDIPVKARELVNFMKPASILTDVGSVKESIVAEVEKIISEGRYFVGSHPITGGELSGFESSRDDLYQGALTIVSPTENTDSAALEKVVQLWERLGSEVIALDPVEHDQIYAGVSHLPHAVAFALMNAVGSMRSEHCGDILPFGGKGLLDYTRIAGSDPIMWRDIFLANRKQVLNCLSEFQDILDKLKKKIEIGDRKGLLELFERSNLYREKLSRYQK